MLSRYPGALPPVLENVRRAFSPGPTDCPWVSEDEVQQNTEGKSATAKEIAEFSVAFVVSKELVKNYVDHLKQLSYCKNL